jgi:hypothetical protein
MSIAALISWLATALGGFYMLGTWIARGGVRSGRSRLPAPVVLGHFLLAAAGLVVWIVQLFAGGAALAWTAFVLLLPVALLGYVMFARWLPSMRARTVAAQGAPGAAGEAPAESAFPLPIVLGHGLLAVVTLVLVLLSALQA